MSTHNLCLYVEIRKKYQHFLVEKKAHTWSYVCLHNCEICITFAVFLKKLRQMVTLGRFSAIFDNGDNFCDLVFAFLHIKPPSEKWSTHAEQIVSF